MKFGGHETFPIREGWLHKGLKLLIENPDMFSDKYVADFLGVGRNMAKSIRHWLLATNLASMEFNKEDKELISSKLQPTEFGKLVWDKDPYFLEIVTWWALHINLVKDQLAGSWHLFFNHFSSNRFDKSVCFEAQKRYLEMSSQRMPSLKTLERDLNCLLASYSIQIPSKLQDPEDASNCPFQELGLLRYFKSSGYYEIDRGVKNIPAHILGYVLSIYFEEARTGEGIVDLSFQKITQLANGPIGVLALTSESLFELSQNAESELSSQDFCLVGLAGERMVRIQKKSSLQWIEECYQKINESVPYAP